MSNTSDRSRGGSLRSTNRAALPGLRRQSRARLSASPTPDASHLLEGKDTARASAIGAAVGRSWQIDSARSTIRFQLRHLVLTEIAGRFGRWRASVNIDEANPARSTVEAVLDVDSLETGDAERDAHIRSPEFLDAETFPEIRFRSRSVQPRGANQYLLVGELTLRGVARDVCLELVDVDLSPSLSPRRKLFSAHARLNRQDLGLHWNQDLAQGGTILRDNIEVVITIELTSGDDDSAPAKLPATSAS